MISYRWFWEWWRPRGRSRDRLVAIRSTNPGESGKSAREISEELATEYWSVWRLALQVILFALASLMITMATLSISTMTTAYLSDVVPVIVLALLCAGAAALGVWTMYRMARTGSELGSGARAWARYAGRKGVAAELERTWRRPVRIALGAIGVFLGGFVLWAMVERMLLPALDDPSLALTPEISHCLLSLTFVVLSGGVIACAVRGPR